MLTFNRFNLTSEQIEQIDLYRHKWEQIALSKDINREQVKLAINKAYGFMELSEPQILFFASPYEALEYIYDEVTNSWGKLNNSSLGSPIAGNLIAELLGNIRSEIKGELLERLKTNLDKGLADHIASETANKLQVNELFTIVWANVRDMAIASAKDSDADDFSKIIFNLFFEAGFVFNRYLSSPLWEIQNQLNSFFSGQSQTNYSNANHTFSMLFSGLSNQNNQTKYQLPIVEMSSRFSNVIVPSVMADYAYYIDYCHQVLNCPRDSVKWDVFSDLVTNCGWTFLYEKKALVCDRQN